VRLSRRARSLGFAVSLVKCNGRVAVLTAKQGDRYGRDRALRIDSNVRS
jgi:hypothetical protein